MPDIDLAMRPMDMGMADRVDAAKKAVDSDSLTRFVDGICRAVGAIAGCLVVYDQQDDDDRRLHGRVAVDAATESALTILLASAPTPGRRGHAWLREAIVPGHHGLVLDASVAGVSRQLALLFDLPSLDESGAVERIMTMAPGLAAAAGAMHDTWLACDATAERQRLLVAAMNQSECGIIVVRADHSVLFSNPAAQAILATRDGIELRRDQLRPTRYQDAIRFQASLDHVLTLPAEAGLPSRHSMMLLLDRPDQHRPLIAVIAPAAAESAEGGAAAIVYVMRPELSGLRGVEVICQLHGLSPVETQLVARLVAGATLSEAASEMRIKPDTARAYLKQVFAKTDTHRQADLIQLVIRYQRAVRGDFLFHAA